MRVIFLVAVSMIAFAANSVLARMALGAHEIDPLAYTGIRIATAALALAVLIAWRGFHRDPATVASASRRRAGSWAGAFWFAVYGITFALAYQRVQTAPGALILFASVQFSMLVWALLRGERPTRLEWLGMAIAFAALVYLLLPGLVAPPLPGALLMVVAGIGWGAYCLVGRNSNAPLADTAGNFIRCAPVGAAMVAAGVLQFRPSVTGLLLATISGAIMSGMGYIVWYTVLPLLSRVSAASVQLTVPAIAALGGMVLISEPLTLRVVLASCGIIGGVALALAASRDRPHAHADAT